MRKITLLFLSISLFILSCKNNRQAAKRTMFTNAVIFSCDIDNPYANSMIIENEIIIFIGDSSAAKDFISDTDSIINLNGKMITPGFCESHMHPAMATISELNFNMLSESATMNDILNIVDSVNKANPDAAQLMFKGYNRARFNSLPTAKDLDAIVNDKPVMLFDEGFHSAWVNSKCFEISNITKDTPDPAPGVQYFVRDKNGNPTGYLIDLLTWQRVLDGLSIFNEDIIYKGLCKLIPTLNSFGFTSVFDAGAVPNHIEQFNAVATMDSASLLNIHYCGSYCVNPTETTDISIRKLTDLHNRFKSQNLSVNTLKIFMDGTVEAKSAAMIRPLNGEDKISAMFMTEEKLYNFLYEALSQNYNTHVHAIGDSAVSATISAYEKLYPNNFLGTKTICHNQVYPLHGKDRIKNLKGLFFQTTPSWMIMDDYSYDVLGKERINLMYPTNSASKSGLYVTFGSDYPASPFEDLNPIKQIYYAVLRGEDNDILYPSKEEGITVEQAIEAYTINGAKQLGIDNRTGSLKPGLLADFVIINKDLTKIPTKDIPSAKVVNTYFRGKQVYQQTQ